MSVKIRAERVIMKCQVGPMSKTLEGVGLTCFVCLFDNFSGTTWKASGTR